MNGHTTNSIVMCRPLHFGFNEQTGADNEFQHRPLQSESDKITTQALAEFDKAVKTFLNHGIEILVLEHPDDLNVPDAVFPNNWFTTHSDGSIRLYPMKTPNRRQEVVPHRLRDLLTQAGYKVAAIESVESCLQSQQILEGTGAIIFDHEHQYAYAALSERCEEKIFLDYCLEYDCVPVIFHAASSHQQPIYHTNVIMSVGTKFAVVCSEALELKDRNKVTEQLEAHGKQVVDITFEQMEQSFCGNILEIKNNQGQPCIAMSNTAWLGFTAQQRQLLESFGQCIVNDVKTIEHIGGGSMRCMMAENFLPRAD